ncbi:MULTISPECIES: DNA repair protein RadC [unclassified Roseovarius]|uniref:RadC family protein n=1 Tax=unclassified Roseovarius TaxID=2614913 RepID=UPI00273D0689|nr:MULTISPECIES: DNA repair protein RadC [unclassified Roseovarius]
MVSKYTDHNNDTRINNAKERGNLKGSFGIVKPERSCGLAEARTRSRVVTKLKVNLMQGQGQSVNLLRKPDIPRTGCGANNNDECIPSFAKTNSLRILSGGAEYLLDSEILELLLFDVPNVSNAQSLATRLLQEFGNLNHVMAASDNRLQKIESVSDDVFVRLSVIKQISLRMSREKVLGKEVISCWRDLLAYCSVSMAYKSKEQFRVFYLDKKNAVIADEEQAEGTIDHVPVYPRELAKRALELDASAIILAHNHPSGDPTPSHEDIEMTKSVIKTCQAIGVSVHDHIIIGKSREISFRERGLI